VTSRQHALQFGPSENPHVPRPGSARARLRISAVIRGQKGNPGKRRNIRLCSGLYRKIRVERHPWGWGWQCARPSYAIMCTRRREAFIDSILCPILFHLAPHRRRRRVLELEPVLRFGRTDSAVPGAWRRLGTATRRWLPGRRVAANFRLWATPR
jgi:hypothetical protein